MDLTQKLQLSQIPKTTIKLLLMHKSLPLSVSGSVLIHKILDNMLV